MTFRTEFAHHDDLRRAAVDEFCARGYDAASINRILAASGVSKGQLYHHFASKEGLYLALVEWMIDAKAEWFTTHPLELSADPVTALGQKVSAGIDFALDNPDIDRFARSLLAERGRPVYNTVVARFDLDPDSAIGTLLEQGHRDGTVRSDLSVEFLQRVVLLLVNHAPDLLDPNAPADMDDQLDELHRFLHHALASSSTWPEPSGTAGGHNRSDESSKMS